MNNIIITSNGIVGTNFSKEFILKNLRGKTVLIIDNGAKGTGNEKEISNNVNKFKEYNSSKVDCITLNNKNLDIIFNYNICYFIGGSISNLLDLVQNTNIKEKLNIFLKTGMYIGESAGGIILEKDTKWYFDLKRNPKLQKVKPKYNIEFKSYKGFGIIDRKIYPHINREKKGSTVLVIKSVAETLNDGEYIDFSYLKKQK